MPVAIMGDLQVCWRDMNEMDGEGGVKGGLTDTKGPKFRIGELKEHKAIQLVAGAKLKLSVGTDLGTTDHIFTKNAAVVNGLSVGTLTPRPLLLCPFSHYLIPLQLLLNG